MDKNDFQTIYKLLKTADAYNSGYTRKQFLNDEIYINLPQQENAISEQANKVAENQTIQTDAQQVCQKTEEVISVPKQEEHHGITLAEINSKIERCTRCQLARTRNNVVPGMGVENPEVMVIGEGPGNDEDIQGKPFVGKAGILLDKMLNAINLSRTTNTYIANVVKCRPPENRDPSPVEQDACISFLEAQIHILKPKMILCLGRISSQKLLKTEQGVNALRGSFKDYNGIPVLVTYHPSALLRNEELKKPAWEDLKMFRRKLDELK